LAQSRKRKKERRRSAEARRPVVSAAEPANGDPAQPPAAAQPRAAAQTRGYARSRAKNDAARAALKPLARGERPTAVTVGAIAAVVLAATNVIAMIAGWNSLGGDTDEGRAATFTILWSVILLVVAWGMWRSRYWAVLGMQTLLGITLVLASLSLITANSIGSVLILVVILAAAGTLFWFLVKAMARIQMPERPTRAR
jgi:hypothetical protein